MIEPAILATYADGANGNTRERQVLEAHGQVGPRRPEGGAIRIGPFARARTGRDRVSGILP